MSDILSPDFDDDFDHHFEHIIKNRTPEQAAAAEINAASVERNLTVKDSIVIWRCRIRTFSSRRAKSGRQPASMPAFHQSA